MTTDQIDKMIEQWKNTDPIDTAGECGDGIFCAADADLRALVRMAVEAEREACAKVAEGLEFEVAVPYHHAVPMANHAFSIAAAIRNRKEHP